MKKYSFWERDEEKDLVRPREQVIGEEYRGWRLDLEEKGSEISEIRAQEKRGI